ncbi:MAG: ABC transporter substrate-binding protein [Chloroflexaceae bacterium]
MSRRTLDIIALLLLLLYAGIAASAQFGGRFAITPLDPTWTAIQLRGTLRVATDVGFRPFADEQNGELVGYDVELARAVATKLGLEVAFVPTGFDALYDSLTSDKADMIAAALPYAPELSYRARFSTFYFDAGLVLVVRDDSAIAGTDDLAGQRVGVALGSAGDAYARRLDAAENGLLRDSSYEEVALALTDLRQGRLDAVITDNVAALIAVQSRPGLRIATALTSLPYVLAVPPEAFQLQAEVNRALEELREEDFFTRLNERWFRE